MPHTNKMPTISKEPNNNVTIMTTNDSNFNESKIRLSKVIPDCLFPNVKSNVNGNIGGIYIQDDIYKPYTIFGKFLVYFDFFN